MPFKTDTIIIILVLGRDSRLAVRGTTRRHAVDEPRQYGLVPVVGHRAKDSMWSRVTLLMSPCDGTKPLT